MSYTADLTADLALWIAGLLREMLTSAPPSNQRNTAEWLIEQLDVAGSAERGGPSPSMGGEEDSDQGSAAATSTGEVVEKV